MTPSTVNVVGAGSANALAAMSDPAISHKPNALMLIGSFEALEMKEAA